MTKPRRPRRATIVRRFLAGESINNILTVYWTSGLGRLEVESAIRAELNKPRSKKQ